MPKSPYFSMPIKSTNLDSKDNKQSFVENSLVLLLLCSFRSWIKVIIQLWSTFIVKCLSHSDESERILRFEQHCILLLEGKHSFLTPSMTLKQYKRTKKEVVDGAFKAKTSSNTNLPPLFCLPLLYYIGFNMPWLGTRITRFLKQRLLPWIMNYALQK